MNKTVEKKLPQWLSTQAMKDVDHWIAKYPADQRQSAVMSTLMIAQEEHGWLSQPLIAAVADYLRMPEIAVYEVATFYSMYELEPVGKHCINVCTNISCKLSNSDKVVKHLQEKLGVELGGTTNDDKFTLREVECLGACAGAPMMQVDKQYHENLTEEKIDQILSEY